MSPKTKITLIFWWIITIIFAWVVFVMSLLWWDSKNVQSDILHKKIVKTHTKNNKNNTHNINSNNEKQIPKNIVKKEHTLKILTLKKLNNEKAWKKFAKLYKEKANWTIKVKYYENIDDYKKDLITKLALKDNDFDLAIIPSQWFNNISYLSDKSFKIQNSSFQISSIFDSNFEKYTKNNSIKAIPFALDPIIAYSINKEKKLDTNQTLQTWKNIILTDSKRYDSKWDLKTMPLFLWYDESYLKYLEKEQVSLFPVFDYILNYYIFKKYKDAVLLIKDLWTKQTYKTFNLDLYFKYAKRYKKISFCKENIKYCLMLHRKSKLVYGFMLDRKFFDENKIKIYRKFKVKPKNLRFVSLPLPNETSEYPAKAWIIIINPNSKNINFLWTFIENYIKLGNKWELPFYKYMISPFLSHNQIKDPKLDFMNKYIWRFITFDKMNMWAQTTLSKKVINYLKWDINIDILLR